MLLSLIYKNPYLVGSRHINLVTGLYHQQLQVLLSPYSAMSDIIWVIKLASHMLSRWLLKLKAYL